MHLYTLHVLTLGLVWHGFNDAIKDGDGDRIMIYWKFLLVIFKAGRRSNYCKEAINLLLQYLFLLPKWLAKQLKWSCCVNTRGVIGGSIPSDLHLEHLNRHFKGINSNLKALILIYSHQPCFKINWISTQHLSNIWATKQRKKWSGRHTRPSFKKECQMMISFGLWGNWNLVSIFIDVLKKLNLRLFHSYFRTVDTNESNLL